MTKSRLVLVFIIPILLITMSSSAQQPGLPYEKEWKLVEDFVKKDLPQSAMAEVKKIYTLATSKKQEAQILKALAYMAGLQSENREDNEQLVIAEWEKELAGKSPAVTSILYSFLAERYWYFYQQNRWKFYNRTETVNFNSNDITTWSPQALHARIAELYKKSLADEALLQQTKLEPFDAIIMRGNSRNLRPTLFDLLAHRALSYFENDESMLGKPTYAFEIEQASAFDPAADFVHRKFTTTDTASLQFQALLLYQRIIRFHLNDEKPDALLDADLLRLEYVRKNSTHPDKEELYYTSVNHIAHQYNQTPAAAQAWFLLAQYHRTLGQKYEPLKDTAYRYEVVKAHEICRQVINNKLNTAGKDTSEGWVNARNLIREIETNELDLRVELVNLPSQPFRASVRYRNTPRLYLRLLKWDENLAQVIENSYDDEGLKKLENWPTVRKWEQSLPATNDYQSHRTEIKIDGLDAGKYVLYASAAPNARDRKQPSGTGTLYVSQISYFHQDLHYYVVNRETGQPLAGASVQEWRYLYDNKRSAYVLTKASSYTTDKNGYYKEAPEPDVQKNGGYRNNYLLEIKHGNDRLFLEEQLFTWHDRNKKDESKPRPSLFLFTDRSIYRPGQTLHVKGILLQTSNDSKNADVLVSYSTKLLLRDANGQTIDSVAVKSNEFGSFSAKFTLPSSGLTGHFSLYTKNEMGSSGFRVEEYKRAKFEVTYEPVKASFRVGDSIAVTGLAKAYAGNNIDGASVSYRVVREARFPFPWWGRSWWPSNESREITHGEVTTNAEGKFDIRFLAIPDKKIKPELNPYFDYVVYADVTDLNGETRSGETRVTAAYTALKFDISLAEKLPADSLHKISLVTQNTAGQFITANVKATVWRLKTENRLIRESFWQQADQYVMTKEEYVKHFPFDEYANESDYKTWEKEKEVLTQTDSSRADGKWSWTNKKWAPGFYVIEFTSTDAYGKEVKAVHYLEVYDPKQNTLNQPKYLWVEGSNSIEPGGQTNVLLATASKDIFLVQLTDRASRSEEAYRETMTWNGGQKKFSFDASENDRGGYGLSWAFVKNNRFYYHDETIRVPWSNKDLNIEYLTWRDKTLPGSQETWKVRITGNKKDKVAAELLGSMYDASLDQFYPHYWGKPAVYPVYYKGRTWNQNNFKSIDIYPGITGEVYPDYFEYKTYDYLWSGVPSYSTRYNFASGVAMQANRMEESRITVRGMASAKVESGYMDAMAAPPPSEESLANATLPKTTIPETTESTGVATRKNFNETAFFLPDLRTDSTGAIEFSFTLPEALTRWKFQALAHTKDLSFGYSSQEMVTQKELMLQPNPPRFFREGDKVELSAKVVNLTDKALSGEARIELLDATTNQPLDSRFGITVPSKQFTAAAGQSSVVSFQLSVPAQFTQPITWRMVAAAGNHSDGEEASLPVLSNRMLVTESVTLFLKGAGIRNYSFDKLKQPVQSNSLQHHRVTVEYTSNPAWYAVQALPYLMEYPYECAEQNWNRYYANALASFVTNSSPRIREVFEQWKNVDTAALLSNLQKNQELKNILLEETPWVLEAKSETEQKKNIALLFDLVRMRHELNGSIEKLKQMQNESGAFPWFKGGPDDRYVTQYILTGIGHLQQLKALPAAHEKALKAMVQKALGYLDYHVQKDYEALVKAKADLKKQRPSYPVVQYLYMRSFFPNEKVTANAQKAVTYFRGRLPLSWTGQNKYMQAMIALTLNRQGNAVVAKNILKSLLQTSVYSEEMGRYHKSTTRSWWWYEAPLERQALLIEAFVEINKDIKTADELRTWLLKNKQTNRWETTKATAEACYALLLQGTDWLKATPVVTVKLGDKVVSNENSQAEAGTGYFKEAIDGKEIKPDMGNIQVQVEKPEGSGTVGSSWGAVYWQYFEDMDKVTTYATPLQLQKKLFVQRNTDRGPVLDPIANNASIKVGDKVVVRIELKVDRDMEYVHMKDLRAAGMEPTNVLSSYKWQGGLGYYESTRDAATHFFFNQLNKGTYVFEYSLFANNAGGFGNGVTSIECMYAPEFRANSEGTRIVVSNK